MNPEIDCSSRIEAGIAENQKRKALLKRIKNVTLVNISILGQDSWPVRLIMNLLVMFG